MHFPTFTVATTNIFPISNSTKGGQLSTEYNLRAREMVGTNPEVEYEIGPSYVHSMNDFAVSALSSSDIDIDDYSATKEYHIGDYVIYNSATYVCTQDPPEVGPFNKDYWLVITSSSSIIQVSPGRAVINGHYVQSLAPMTVDLALANAQLAKNYEPALLGKLAIGIRAYYSTENTMAGSLLVENSDNTYTGIQLVIDLDENFITPDDSPTDQSKVTAHLKLADFLFVNGAIASIHQNPGKVSYIDSTRISEVEKLFNDNFISKKNLNPEKLYTFSGQGADTDKSTWCDSTGSLMVWDSDPAGHIIKVNPNLQYPQATFVSTNDGTVHLVVPHQQVDSMKNSAGEDIFYNLRDIKLPKANYLAGTPGTIDASYTQVIKDLSEKLSGLQTGDYKLSTPIGNMVLYLSTKDEDYIMPDPLGYSIGDYAFIREDYTANTSEDEGAAPATMYIVTPGFVNQLTRWDTEEHHSEPTGALLGENSIYIGASGFEYVTVEDLQHFADFYSSAISYQTGDIAAHGDALYKCLEACTGDWDPTKWDMICEVNAASYFKFTSYRAYTGYFKLLVRDQSDPGITTELYYVVSGEDKATQAWSDYILLTNGIPLASTIQVGGFYNTDPTATDGGYVTLDENGRLKLIDYSLLRSGTLAYQLGEDFTLPTNVTSDTVQANLDEYVNNRVAFPLQSTLTSTPSMINIYITLPEESEQTVINIYNIDSRFGTGVYLHFLGNANSNTIINVIDCEKIRIDSNIGGTPVINVIRSCIYYDVSVFNYIRACDVNNIRPELDIPTGFFDITLWYDRFLDTDPDLQINGMEVSSPNATMTAEEISFWNEDNPNDNHYSAALRSVTLSGEGDIVACSLSVSNGSTATNLLSGRSIIGGAFTLPQGADFMYPENCLTKVLKVTGSFTTAYPVLGGEWVIIATNFTAQTGIYNPVQGTMSAGTIAFDSITDLIRSENMTVDQTVIDGWRAGSFHIFYGGATISTT